MARLAFRDGLLLAAGVAGAAVFFFLYQRAFPQAAVRLDVTAEGAKSIATTFLDDQGAALGGYREAANFGGNTDALVFLQRTVGLGEASRMAARDVPIWLWNVRWFRPQQKEEWLVGVGIGGTVERFEHELDEAAPGADTTREAALDIAQRFLRQQRWDLDSLSLVESSSQKRDKRTDHHFAWEKRGSTIAWTGAGGTGSGSVRVAVDVKGAAVGSYRHFLHVPEGFQRELEGTMSSGRLLALLSLGLTLIIMLVALAVTIARHRTGDVRWRPALVLGVGVAGLTLLQGLLAWPAARYMYPTEFPWSVYLGTLVVAVLFGSMAYGLWALFAIAAGESLGREVFPESLGAFSQAVAGRVRSPALAGASWRGYVVGFGLLGYLTGFYLFAQRHLGAWLPAEGPYSDIFNSYLPFLAPLTLSVGAAVTEEGTYRLFGISLVRRYTRSTLLALLIPAAIWAFAHSSYPVFPVYIRGIELTIAGVLFGLAFLRLGLMVAMIAHFVVDAVLIGMPLLSSGNTGYVISGVIVMGIALLPAVLGLWAAGRPAAGAGAASRS